MKISGVTTDKRDVVSDLFKYNDTHGIPVSHIIDFIYSKNYVVDWLDLKNKMKISKIIEGIEESILLDKEYKNNVIMRLKCLL